MISMHEIEHLRYIWRQRGKCPVKRFDQHADPDGPALRERLQPYIIERDGGLVLSDQGRREVEGFSAGGSS